MWGEYSSKVPQPGSREMPYTRSSRASPSRACLRLSRTDPGVWAGIRATEQEERHRRVLRLSSGQRPAGNVLNLPFQGRFLPLMQRVSEWQTFSITQGDISRGIS